MEGIHKILEEWSEIRQEKNGLLKLIGIEAVPLVWGATLAGIGRSTSIEYLPAVPLAMDAMTNMQGYTSIRGLWNLTKYGIGIASIYADKIIPLVA